MSARITNRSRNIVTSYLRAPKGWALFGSILTLLDSCVADQETSVKNSRLLSCDDDALDLHARNGNDRRSSLEGAAAMRAHLSRRWDHAKRWGTEEGLRYQLARIGYPVVELVCERDLREAGIAGAFGGKVGYAFCLIRQPHRWPAFTTYWDGGGLWNDGALWGTSMSADAISELIFVLQRYRPSHAFWRFAVLDEDGSTTYDAAGFHGNYQLIPINEDWEFQTGLPLIPDYNNSYLVP